MDGEFTFVRKVINYCRYLALALMRGKGGAH